MIIKILGSGCSRCEKLFKKVNKVIRSYVVKKSILDNLRFNILGRRKYG